MKEELKENIKDCGALCLVLALFGEIAAIIINIVEGRPPFYLFDLSNRFGFDMPLVSIFWWGAVLWIIFIAVDAINKAEIGESDEINEAENYWTVSGKQNKELPIKLTKSLKAFLDEEGKTFLEYKYDEQLKKIYLQGNYQYGKSFVSPSDEKLFKEKITTPVTKSKEVSSKAMSDIYDDLIKLNDLKEKNIITQEEFDAEKKKILNK